MSGFTWGDGNEQVGAQEIDKAWAEAVKILLHYDPVDEGAVARALAVDESTLALLYFHLHSLSDPNPGNGFMTGADRESKDPRETGMQLRPDFGTRSTSDIRAR